MRFVVDRNVVMRRMTKQSRTADKGWSFRLGFGKGLTPHRKPLAYFGMFQRASELDRFFGKT